MRNLLVALLVVNAGCTQMGFTPPGPTREAAPVALGRPELNRSADVTTAAGDASTKVIRTGKQLLTNNPQAALRVAFVTTGSPVLDVHHEGESRIVISDGLVNLCTTEAQLAGVLALEMASIVAQRNAWLEQGTDRLPPMEVRIGQDGNMGYADQIYKAEVVKLGMDRRKPAGPATPPEPEKLAGHYLVKAGFGDAELPAAHKLWLTAQPGGKRSEERVMPWPTDWSAHLGKSITLEGTAVNAKVGALLRSKESEIWIDGLASWPQGFYAGGDQGKRLRVTGAVIKKDDLPVFVQRPGDLPKAGMPVQSEEELQRAKWRYLLKDAKWTILD